MESRTKTTQISHIFRDIELQSNQLKTDLQNLTENVYFRANNNSLRSLKKQKNSGKVFINDKLLTQCNSLDSEITDLESSLLNSHYGLDTTELEALIDQMEIQTRMTCAYMSEYGFQDPFKVIKPETSNSKRIVNDKNVRISDDVGMYDSTDTPRASRQSHSSRSSISSFGSTHLLPPKLAGDKYAEPPSPTLEISSLTKELLEGSADSPSSLGRPSGLDRLSLTGSIKSSVSSTITPPPIQRTNFSTPSSNFTNTPPIPSFSSRFDQESVARSSLTSRGSESLLGKSVRLCESLEFDQLPEYLKAQLNIDTINEVIGEINDIVT
ncbi:hypothetical protein HK096_004604, partial [Nowakowskiella sp. JEL0078]